MCSPLDRIVCTALAIAIGTLAVRGGLGLLSPSGAEDDAAKPKPLIAVCSIPTLINELMASDRYRPALEGVEPEAREELKSVAKELQEIRDSLQGADPKSDDAQQKFGKFRELSVRASQLQQKISEALDKKSAEQMAECFELVRTSADAIAADLGFEYVISTGSPDEHLSKDHSEATLRQITARPMVRFPKAADITDDVRDDLKLD